MKTVPSNMISSVDPRPDRFRTFESFNSAPFFCNQVALGPHPKDVQLGDRGRDSSNKEMITDLDSILHLSG